MILNIEKTVKDNGDKIEEADKTALNNAVEEAKKHLTSESLDEIKKAQEDLTKVSNDVFTKMYQKMAQQQPQGENPNGNNSNNGNNGNGNKDGDPEVIVEDK